MASHQTVASAFEILHSARNQIHLLQATASHCGVSDHEGFLRATNRAVGASIAAEKLLDIVVGDPCARTERTVGGHVERAIFAVLDALADALTTAQCLLLPPEGAGERNPERSAERSPDRSP